LFVAVLITDKLAFWELATKAKTSLPATVAEAEAAVAAPDAPPQEVSIEPQNKFKSTRYATALSFMMHPFSNCSGLLRQPTECHSHSE
jgi:hypothetical protein